jgi:hypothetical protein
MNKRMGSGGEIEEHWISSLAGTFTEEGLGGVKVFRREMWREMWRYRGENCAGAIEEAAGALGLGGEGLREMARERERGEYAFYEPQVVVGWKGGRWV